MSIEIPGYEILDVLGQGGMATVHLAKQEKFDRVVALKVMASQLAHNEEFRERFLREARIVANISHPNIVSVYDVGEFNGHYYLSMEYHSGGDLKAKIKKGIDYKECLYILKDVCKALDFAHHNNIIHRDIKPDNILFRFDNSAVLADFGIAKALESDSNLTQVGMMAGTPKYMSPEQAVGGAVTHQSDLYSVGIVLYEMLTGDVPYSANDPISTAIMHTKEPIPMLPASCIFIQPLLQRLLAKKPKDRFASGKDVVEALNLLINQFQEDKTVLISSLGTGLNSVAFKGSKRLKKIGLGLALGLGLSVGVFSFFNSGVTSNDSTISSGQENQNNLLGANDKAAEFQIIAKLDQQTLVEITKLLSLFEGLLAQDRLKSPREENAALVVQKILLLDPENRAALKNKIRIGERYLDLALQSAERSRYKKSQALLSSAGEFISYQNILLVEAKIELLRAKSNSGENRVIALRDKLRVQALLRQARNDEKNNRITLPKGNNALQKVQAALKIDPQNPEAKALLIQISN